MLGWSRAETPPVAPRLLRGLKGYRVYFVFLLVGSLDVSWLAQPEPSVLFSYPPGTLPRFATSCLPSSPKRERYGCLRRSGVSSVRRLQRRGGSLQASRWIPVKISHHINLVSSRVLCRSFCGIFSPTPFTRSSRVGKLIAMTRVLSPIAKELSSASHAETGSFAKKAEYSTAFHPLSS